jgi:hypothetical protein
MRYENKGRQDATRQIKNKMPASRFVVSYVGSEDRQNFVNAGFDAM